jgi:antitoxin (DNA-binding transcriptional repressor) of toxin-antitoxin stability system
MLQVSIEELPQKLESLLHEIEKGESCLLVKAGNPVAEIKPVQKASQGWKRKIDKIELPKGLSAQSYIEQERQIR